MKIPDEVKSFIEEGRLAYVATTDKLGIPNVVPKGTIAVLDDEHLIFADLFAGKTRRNLEENPVISIAIVNQAAYRGYQLKGRAQLISRGPFFDDVKKRIEGGQLKYPQAKYAVKIKVERIYDISLGANSGREITG